MVFQPAMVGVDQCGLATAVEMVLNSFPKDQQQRLVNVCTCMFNCVDFYPVCVCAEGLSFCVLGMCVIKKWLFTVLPLENCPKNEIIISLPLGHGCYIPQRKSKKSSKHSIECYGHSCMLIRTT